MDAHHRLVIWQDARRLVRVVYRVTTALPPDERFVAVPQIRRAACTLRDLYPIDSAAMDEAQGRRRRINAGLFSMLRTRRR